MFVDRHSTRRTSRSNLAHTKRQQVRNATPTRKYEPRVEPYFPRGPIDDANIREQQPSRPVSPCHVRGRGVQPCTDVEIQVTLPLLGSKE